MSTDEKIAEILFYLSLRSTMEVSNVIALCKIQRCDDAETHTIIQTLESEGYATSVPHYEYGYMALTDLGKQVGRSKKYLELVEQRKTHKARQPEQQIPSTNDQLDQRTAQVRLVTVLSGLVLALVGLCTFQLNQHLRAAKGSVDSLRTEVRTLCKEVKLQTRGLQRAGQAQSQSTGSSENTYP